MAGDRRIGLVRQPELAQAGAPIAADGDLRPAAVIGRNSSSVRLDVLARQIGGRSQSPISDRPAPSTVIGTRSGAASPSSRSLAALHMPPERDRCVIASRTSGRDFGDPALDERRQREIDVVAAEQQVIANRDPLERRRAGLDAGRGSG